ncbi:type VI secretion system baseplate subunit TssG [Janthinobacterium sp. PLB04]|uniref:Type VI secretion system baseplate subunit TssG n=1 Tax=Janthinobacterium lividum TaxID=29581 RepID=A0AAJ4MUZ6_9BURK|nr:MULTISPECIES: type VI secretion system baseplate subunit TssG [Janthinobacterium]KAB0331466.1 type VI secretion system baseplate subunit TssG [Janthinobacterium lividum]QSX97660.1 type VI secretion system baseplate subunit TssG [Janthinobacterium lividum]UGQ37608.1 type VI secretion system baseplate subunit TssG [Janthinobacterium sp. PLB04]
MPRTQRRRHASVIQQLLDAPQRFECFQALRLLLAWLAEHGIDEHTALAKHIRFDNSVSLRFPASQVETLTANSIGDADALLQALLSGHGQHIHLTPTFMGLLGCQGSLPSHYSERIAAHQHSERENSPRAFLDLFSSRTVALFYQAWRKYRIEQAGHSGDFLSRLLALAACQPGQDQGQDVAAAGLYSGLLQQHNISSIVMARILGDHFGVPCHIDEATGAMDMLAPREQTALGMENAMLGQRALVGERCRRPDLAVRLRLGPLTAQQHASFLPRAPGSHALRHMLMLFGQPLVRYDIVLVLRASDVRGTALTTSPQGGLGCNSFLGSAATPCHRDDKHYEMQLMPSFND